MTERITWRATITEHSTKQSYSRDFITVIGAMDYLRQQLDKAHAVTECPDIVYILAKDDLHTYGECTAEGTTFKLERILTTEEPCDNQP